MCDDSILMERYALAMERISLIQGEQRGKEGVFEFFYRTAGFICEMAKLKEFLEEKESQADLDTLRRWNQKIYEDITEEAYETSYANPAYARRQTGGKTGKCTVHCMPR